MRLHRLTTFIALALLMLTSAAHAQSTFKQLPVRNPDYVKPFSPLRVVGNLYYVGTYDLGVYLITTPEGNILINTGVNDSVPGIRANIEALGFKPIRNCCWRPMAIGTTWQGWPKSNALPARA